MGFLKKLFGNDNETVEERPKKVEPVVELPPKRGFDNTIPPVSKEWLKKQSINAYKEIGMYFDEQVIEKERFFEFAWLLDCKLKCEITVMYLSSGISCSAALLAVIPQERYGEIMELIARINHRFVAGHFTLEFGKLEYKTFLINNGKNTAVRDIVKTIETAYQVLNGYGNAIVKTINGIGTPEENVAIANKMLFS